MASGFNHHLDLLALMKNQVEGLRHYRVKVHILCSETTAVERRAVRPNIV